MNQDGKQIIEIGNSAQSDLKTEEKLQQQQQNEINMMQTIKDQQLQLQQFDQCKSGLFKTVLKNGKHEPLQSIIFFQDTKNKTEDSLQQSAIEIDQFDTEFRKLQITLNHNEQLINPLKLQISTKITADNREVMFYVLSDQLKKANRDFFISKKPDNLLMYSFQGQFTAESKDSLAYCLVLKETQDLSYQKINSDKSYMEQFLTSLKKSLLVDLQLPEYKIQLIALEKGSIKVIFQIIDPEGVEPPPPENFDEVQRQFPGSAPYLSIHEYFKTAALSEDDFVSQFNCSWEDFVFGDHDQRGPEGKTQPYFFPVGWHGYALNVAGKYGTNDNWLQMNNNKDEWYVMFHGTNFKAAPNIVKQGFKAGNAQMYENETCLLTKQQIGKGVYLSNHIEVCEGYAQQQPTQIGNEQFILAFQSRVRPEALRQCQKTSDLKSYITEYKINNKYKVNSSLKDMKLWDNDYFVVNNTCDIRPYRILIKQLPRRQ